MTVARFFRSQGGPTTVEYALMLALIVIVATAAISGVGVKVSDVMGTVDNGMPQGGAS